MGAERVVLCDGVGRHTGETEQKGRDDARPVGAGGAVVDGGMALGVCERDQGLGYYLLTL